MLSVPEIKPDLPLKSKPFWSRLSRQDTAAGLLAAGVTVLLCVMLVRVAQLQLQPSAELRPFISEHVHTVRIPAERSIIEDRRGRALAASRFGHRVFVDPTEFPTPPDEAIIKLAGAMGMEPVQIAERILPKLGRNERIKEQAKDPLDTDDLDPDDAPPPKLSRYVTIGRVIEDWREDMVKAARIPGVHLEMRQVRETTGGVLAAPLVGKVGSEDHGLVGIERMLDPFLQPAPGHFSYVRDASGDPMWTFPGAYEAPRRAGDIRLSLDLEIQRIVCEELDRGVEECNAAGGRAIVVDPITGEILAMVDRIRDAPGVVDYDWQTLIPKTGSGHRYRTIRPDTLRADHPELGRNRCVEDVYEPGSTFKPFMWAVTTELGLARLDEVIDTHWGEWTTPYGRHLADVVKRERQTWKEVLVNSSNIGMAQGTARMSFQQMHDAVVRFGFGHKTDIGIPGESPGIVTSLKSWSKFSQTSVAMGHEVAVTPLQMVHGFCAFARPGELAGTLPPLRIVGLPSESAVPGVRVLTRQIAETTRETMRGVTHNLDTRMSAKDPEATLFRYEAFGKSGTAEIPLGLPPPGKKRPKGSDGYYRGQYNSSFIAGAPVENPRLVVLVVIDDPGPDRVASRTHYGASTAGPVNRRIMERALAYLGVPPTYSLDQLRAEAASGEAHAHAVVRD